MFDDAVPARIGISCFSFCFSTWKWHPRCGLNLLETNALVQVVYRGSFEPLSFAPLPSDWTSSNWGGIFTFWHGALVPLDLSRILPLDVDLRLHCSG